MIHGETQRIRRALQRGARAYRTAKGFRASIALVRSKETVVEAPPYIYRALLYCLSSRCVTMLDIGTGLMDSLTFFPCKVKVGLDVHRPYLAHRHSLAAVPINADARALGQLFVQASVDLVTLLDVVEHFTEAEAHRLLKQAEAIARRRVIVMTPRGVFPQEAHDAFGLGGEEFQRHRSAWDVEQFTALGYRVAVLRGFHDHRNESFVRAFGATAPPVDALVAWKDVDEPADSKRFDYPDV